ncbi:hypothetical protein MKX01_029895 [Papaver californicum]|nr:hypothetical protein MKX01_029895 [Papaver californicum]
MGTRNHGNFLSLLLLLSFSLLLCKCSSIVDFDPTTITVKNDIQGYEVSLDMHCMSKDDDLGQRSLRVGEEWHWNFLPSLIKNTVYWCDFRWYDNIDYRWYDGTFEMYKGNGWRAKFSPFCRDDCSWSIRRDGAYLFRRDRNEWERRGTWH